MTMPSIRDLYTYYLTAAHLQGRSAVVHITAASVEELWNRQLKRKEHKLILRFHGKKLALACNKTQASQLEHITGSDDYTQWTGHTVTLSPGKAPTGADTILITAAPAAANGAPHPPKDMEGE
jgi:hypothetical protein